MLKLACAADIRLVPDDREIRREFPFAPQLGGHPPNRRVVEQKRFDGPLDEAHPRVEPADVDQFVRDHHLKFA